MYIEVLNNLTESIKSNGEHDGALEGKFNYQGTEVTVCIDPDDEKLDITVGLAKRFLSNLEGYELKAKDKILKEMFDQYNEDWRQENEPVLTKEEFLQKLTLVQIWFSGADSVDFMYRDGGMFGGDSLIPRCFNGETFTYVQIYG